MRVTGGESLALEIAARSDVPALVGNIAATRQRLDDSGIDVSNLSCGGIADDNNVWGEGRLDAFTAVSGGQKPPSVGRAP